MANLIRILSLLCGFLIAVSATGAKAEPDRKVGHVIVIGIDGLSRDGVITADTPALDDMMAKGSWTLNARGVFPTTSSANWASILTGAGPEQHGVTSNDWRVGQAAIPASVIGSDGFYPSIFQLLKEQRPDWKIGSIYNWAGFADLYDSRFVDYNAHGETENKTAQLAVDYIKAEKPEFLFVHLDNVDHVGHGQGHGTSAYYEAVTQADSMVGQIRQAVVDAGIASKTVILVTSDHGGVGKGHGGETLDELEIPWIISGQSILQSGRLDMPVNTFDTTATVAWLLGANLPYAWLGKPVKAAVIGEAASKQTYRPSSLYAAPVIEPEGEGNAPSGGLFINQSAQMKLRNPNGVGEIRYTLDGSNPTLASILYADPVQIERNTIVRATLFVEGKAASVPSSAFFRMLDLTGGKQRGVSYKVYLLSEGSVRLPDFSTLEPVANGSTYEFSIDDVPLPRGDYVAVVFEGFLQTDEAGEYSFSLASDDGSKLYIDDKTIVDNDGDHGVITASGSAHLASGRHKIRVEYFNGGGGSWLGAYFKGPGIPLQFIDPNLLSP